MKHYDLIVIGFGKAGKTIAATASKKGLAVALIEKDSTMYGGTCVNIGCLPSKRLIIDALNHKDYSESIQEKKTLITLLRQANYKKMNDSEVEIIDGTASFIDANIVEVVSDNHKHRYSADRFIINTGAKAFIPPIKGIESNPYVYTAETIMNLEVLPKKLAVIGGGYIGLEFASMYAHFGSEVTVIQDGSIFLPREDEDIAELVLENLKQKAVQVVTSAKVEGFDANKVIYSVDNKKTELEVDAILIATGRRANIDDLNLEKAGIKLTDRKLIETDEHLRTSASHIYAAGDVCSPLQFTYVSLDHSRVIIDSIFGEQERTVDDYGVFAYTVFIDPNLSKVGLNEKEAKAAGKSYRVVKIDVNTIPNAKVIRKTTGMMKAIIDNNNNQILGAYLYCDKSVEMINFIKLAIDQKLHYEVIKNFMFTHPSMSEALNDLFSL